jgi:hypothetical protein
MAAFTTIDDAGLFFNTVLYSGNGTAIGSGGNAITGVGFQPDFTWMKQRSGVNNHNLQNSAVGATKYVNSDRNIAQVTNTESLTTWGADGFTLGSLADVNGSGQTFVSWNWKGGTTAVPSGGTITPSSCSFNATSGFGAYQYTGNATSSQTIAHGLGVAPTMIIIKNLTDVETWQVYHEGIGNTKYLLLDTTAGTTTDTDHWQDTSPTSTVFSLGDDGAVNANTKDFIAYVFADVKGYSKMGNYLGNGNVDGTFVYTGFRPAFVMCKYTGVENWAMTDNERLGYNVANYQLYANGTEADVSNVRMDIVSNGFKCRTTNAEWNGTGNTYVYAAFAANPFVNSSGVAGNAR